jgi:predicted dehydrogenase
MDRPVRLALVGAGHWGKNIIRTIGTMPSVQLCHLVTSQDRATLDVPDDCVTTSDWRGLLSARDIDGIVLAVPTPQQVEIAAKTINAGIATFIEKPMALNSQTAKALRDAANARSVHVLIDHIYLFHPAFGAVRNACSNPRNIQRIDSAGGNWGPFRSTISPLWDWGPHDISMCLDLMGAYPDKVTARILEAGATPEDGANFEVTMEFSSGAVCQTTFGNRMKERVRKLQVTQPGETILFEDSSPTPVLRKADTGQTELHHSDTSPLTCAIETFCTAITSGRPETAGLDIAVDVVKILETVELQLRQNEDGE